jgi:hypothetical protein
VGEKILISTEEHNKRVLQAVSYLIEWAKHIITIGSALMILSVGLLKDIVKEAQPPISYVIACLLVLSHLSMLGAIWMALRLVRYASTCVLTMNDEIGNGDELTSLQKRLKRVQQPFLASLMFFSGLALCVLLAWALGLAGSVSH